MMRGIKIEICEKGYFHGKRNDREKVKNVNQDRFFFPVKENVRDQG